MTTSSLAQYYRQSNRWRWLILLILLCLLVLSFLLDMATGPASLPLSRVIYALSHLNEIDRATRVIVLDIRLPYSVMAMVVGAALGLAGAQMQTVLNNPLASPFTLGVAAAATLGASMAIVFEPQLPALPLELMVPLCAFVFALLSTGLTLLLNRWHGGGSETLVLFGIALLFALEAMVWLMQFLADANALEQIVFWSMGSLSRATWPHILLVLIPLLVCFALAMRRAWALTLLRGGEAYAASLGIAVNRLRRITMIEVSLLTAAALAFVGTIGFIGLVGPHIARLLVGEQHRFYLPASMLSGALMLSLASIASKSLIPGLIVPIGIVTALVGVPAFVALILSSRRGG